MDADLLFAYDWNIIFRLTGDGAGMATDAHIKIHHHAPFVAFVRIFLRMIQRVV